MSKRRGRRGLTPEETDLWNKVARGAQPLHPKPVQSEPSPNIPDLFQPTPVQPSPLSPFKVGESATATSLPSLQSSPPPNLKMDRKAFDRLKRGKLKPEARIDLHGMTLAQAGPVLVRFIADSHAKQRRLVLVITGKGKDRDDGGPIPTPKGVLRRQVPQWLSMPPLAHKVLQVTAAHMKHGGDGAFYVYLRRHRQ